MKSKTRDIATSVSAMRYRSRFGIFRARISPRSAIIIAVGTIKSAERYIVIAISLVIVMIVAQYVTVGGVSSDLKRNQRYTAPNTEKRSAITQLDFLSPVTT